MNAREDAGLSGLQAGLLECLLMNKPRLLG